MAISRNTCALFAVVSLLSASCGVGRLHTDHRGDGTTHGGESVSTQHLETAKALARVGRHMEASIYFEAALDGGSNELQVLPLLVSSQVRAGRLEAAKQNIHRLVQIAPNRECVIQLRALLNRLTPGATGKSSGEMK